MVAVFQTQSTLLTSLDVLHAAIDDVAAASSWGLPIDELEAAAVQILRATERMKSLSANVVADADGAGMAARSGFRSLNAHLADKTGMPTRAIAPSNTVGRWLRDYPTFSEAWNAGVLSEAHVRELKALDNTRTHRLLKRDQQLFIDSAPTLDFAAWEQTLAYWLLNADPDGSLSKERAATYGLTFKRLPNGDVDVRGRLDPLTGEALQTAVEHTAENIYRTEEEPIDGTPKMSDRKRNVIALMRLVAKGFTRKDGTFPRPLINIVMSEQIAEKLLANDRVIELDPFDIDKRCETIRGTPLDPRRLTPMLLIGNLRRQIINAKNRTINLGHDVRFFNDAQKQAILVEQRGRCALPGCDAPFIWLHADHRQPHNKGGPTDMWNGQGLCSADNHRKGDQT